MELAVVDGSSLEVVMISVVVSSSSYPVVVMDIPSKGDSISKVNLFKFLIVCH